MVFHINMFPVDSNKVKKVKPDAGLEPATVGLKVQRSTD